MSGSGRSSARRPVDEDKPKKSRGQRSKDYLEPLTSKVKSRKFVVYDIESKADDTQKAGFTRPFLVGVYDGARDRYQEFRDEPHLKERVWHRWHIDPGGCIDKLMATLLVPKYHGAAFYAHNAGSFDALFLLTWLQEHRGEFEFEVVPVQSSIQTIRVWRMPDGPDDPIKERWEFLDSMKLLPMGLEKACRALGVPGKLSHDLEMHEEDPRWSGYLEQDCRALSAVMTRFYDLVENRLGGEVGMTTPSTAMRLFRRRFLGHDGVQEKIPRYRHFPTCEHQSDEGPCDGCLHDWIRLGYYGGRTEIHAFFGEMLRYFDFNSSYAASMLEDMPIGDLFVEEGHLDMRRHKSQGGRYGGFCECTVYVPPECPIPPLPHRDKKTGKLTFPAGQFHGVWSVDELALLSDPLVGGEIRYVRKTVWFGLRPLFQGFVRKLWELRDKTRSDYDEGLSLLAKLILNALYGKFGMKKERTTVVFAQEDSGERCFLCGEALSCDEHGEPTQGICDGCEGSKPACPKAEGEVWYQKSITDTDYMVPQISASITADARVRLWRSMKEVISTDAGERMRASRITPGDVVMLRGVSHVVSGTRASGKKIALELRGPDEEGRTSLGTVTLAGSTMVRMAGRVFYLDSVTSDRTTVVRGPRGIEVLTFAELWERGVEQRDERDKEFRTLEDYQALSRRGEDDDGWWPITQILRHKTDKKTFRVSTKHGQTQVTEDHGIMVDGEETTPEVFIQQQKRFTRVKVPASKPRGRVDLFEHLKHWRLHRQIKKPVRSVILRFKCDDEWIYLPNDWADARGIPPIRFRRWYDSGSQEMDALLSLVGAYVSDGSSSVPGVTNKGTRFILSFCKAKLTLQEKIRDALLLLSRNAEILGPMWTETVYVVRSGTITMACLFAALCGTGSKGKVFPSFVYELGTRDLEVLAEALTEGDGHIDAASQLVFTTTSQKLAAGVSLLMSQHGMEHGFSFRPGKDAWMIRTRPKGSERNRYKLNHEVFTEPVGDGFVYDLTVEGAHTFVDGIGQVLLHNTDSVITNVQLRSSSELGKMKDEYPGETLTYLGVQAKGYLIDRVSRNEEIQGFLKMSSVDPSEDGQHIDPDAAWIKPKVTLKGFPPKLRTAENLRKLRDGEVLEWDRLQKVRSLARFGFKRSPQMERVKKSFHRGADGLPTYDKRIRFGNWTRAIVLHEPFGGVAEEAESAA